LGREFVRRVTDRVGADEQDGHAKIAPKYDWQSCAGDAAMPVYQKSAAVMRINISCPLLSVIF